MLKKIARDIGMSLGDMVLFAAFVALWLAGAAALVLKNGF